MGVLALAILVALAGCGCVSALLRPYAKTKPPFQVTNSVSHAPSA